MMGKVFIFRKVRDFGTVMNHSFDFVKAEYRRLGKALLLYVLPFFVVTGILLVLVQTSMVNDIVSDIGASTQPGAGFFQNFSWRMTGISYLLQLLNFTVLGTVVFSFLNLYLKKGAEFEVTELKASFLKFGSRLLVANIAVGLITVIASVFLIIPGIYLAVVFSLVAPVIVFEELGLGQALSRSFEIIKENWWKTFGILFVGAIIVYIFSIILSIPLIISAAVKSFHAISNQTPAQILSPGYIIISTVVSMIQTFAWSLVMIFIAIQYFSLVEEKERPTLQAKINRMNEGNA